MLGKLSTTVLSLAALGTLAGACLDEPARVAQPLDTSTLGFTAAANLRSAASAWTDATDWLADDTMADWLGGLPAAVTGASDAATDPITDPTTDPAATDNSPAALADDLADRIENELLIPQNLESSDGRSAVYLIPATVVCGVDGVPEPGSADATCVGRFTANPVRVSVVSYAASDLDLTLLIGEPRYAPLVIELHQASMKVTVDVGQALSAFEALDRYDGQLDGSREVVLRHAAGALSLALERTGTHQARATFAVSSPLSVDLDVTGYAVTGALGKSKVTLDLDGDAHRVSLASTLGSLSATAPYQLLADLVAEDGTEPVQVAGKLALDLAGASLSAELDPTSHALKLTHLGLGDRRSTFSLDGAAVVGVDLNAASGRRFDATITADDVAETHDISVSPGLDLVVDLGLRHLAAIDESFATSWAADETLGLALDGADRPAIRVGDGLEVLAGRFALASRSRPELTVEVRAGQCLVGDGGGSTDVPTEPAPADPATTPDEHPFAGLSAGVCGN